MADLLIPTDRDELLLLEWAVEPPLMQEGLPHISKRRDTTLRLIQEVLRLRAASSPTDNEQPTAPEPWDPRDWPEDFSHENGRYSCRCHKCGRLFQGHKRRVTCHVCAGAASSSTAPEPVATWAVVDNKGAVFSSGHAEFYAKQYADTLNAGSGPDVLMPFHAAPLYLGASLSVTPTAARLLADSLTPPPSTCLHGTPFADLSAECVKSDEFDPLNVLDFCAGAIQDAIGLEDGLDGEAGSRVLAMIRTAKARAAVSSCSLAPTELAELREANRTLAHQLERRADGMDALTQALRAENERLRAAPPSPTLSAPT